MSHVRKETAIFAAGCFWGVQYYFDQVPGVLETTAGYTGGHVDHPTYEQVSNHTTGHAEATKVVFDPVKVSFRTLLKHFFRIQDPTAKNAPDGINAGDNYRSAIFYTSEEQKKAAEKIIDELSKSGKYDRPIVTTLERAAAFWPAEGYHQKYTEKTGQGMCHVDYAPV
jgi:peptide methionine sulfoxide reductase msrA/msrB